MEKSAQNIKALIGRNSYQNTVHFCVLFWWGKVEKLQYVFVKDLLGLCYKVHSRSDEVLGTKPINYLFITKSCYTEHKSVDMFEIGTGRIASL